MGRKDIMKDIREGVEMSVLSLKDSVKAGGLAFARLQILSQHWKNKKKKDTDQKENIGGQGWHTKRKFLLWRKLLSNAAITSKVS